MNQTELKHFVTEWMLSQDKDMEFAPDENGYVMFRRGACSINIAAYFQMILEDFLEAQAIESYKDGWVSELDELEKWIKEEAEDFKNSAFSEDRSVGCYLSMCVLGKIQELKSPSQTKTI